MSKWDVNSFKPWDESGSCDMPPDAFYCSVLVCTCHRMHMLSMHVYTIQYVYVYMRALSLARSPSRARALSPWHFSHPLFLSLFLSLSLSLSLWRNCVSMSEFVPVSMPAVLCYTCPVWCVCGVCASIRWKPIFLLRRCIRTIRPTTTTFQCQAAVRAVVLRQRAFTKAPKTTKNTYIHIYAYINIHIYV